MSAEFVDTNVLVYANDGGAGDKHAKAVALISRLVREGNGALSIQVLAEFYSTAVGKLKRPAEEAEQIVADLGSWMIHRPDHGDVIRTSRLYRRHKLHWWDAMVINSAIELRCGVLWSEDLSHLQRYSTVTVRNPFR